VQPTGGAPKRRKTAAIETGESQAVPKKIIVAKTKALLANLKKTLKAQKFYKGWDRTTRDVNIDDVFSKAEFDAVFLQLGKQTQPTPDNNPNSTVILRDLDSADLEAIFGAGIKNIKSTVWTKGGQPQRGFFGSSGFSKSVKLGSEPIVVKSAKLTYRTKSSKLTLKCACLNGESEHDPDSF